MIEMIGKLGFDEFTQLWRRIRHWCSVFRKHDIDKSSTINASELRMALHEMGMSVNRTILQFLVFRYGIYVGGSKKKEHKERALTFDDFIHAAIKLKNCIDTWNDKSKGLKSFSMYPTLPTSNYSSSRTSFLGQKQASFTLDEVSCLPFNLFLILLINFSNLQFVEQVMYS